MLQHLGRQLQDPALHFQRRGVLGFKAFGHVVISAPRVDLRAAGVNVYGSKIVFRPRVNGQVRFGDDDDAGNAVRVKGMENDVHNVRMRVFGGIDHDGFDFVHVVENFGVAVIQLDEEMPAE